MEVRGGVDMYVDAVWMRSDQIHFPPSRPSAPPSSPPPPPLPPIATDTSLATLLNFLFACVIDAAEAKETRTFGGRRGSGWEQRPADPMVEERERNVLKRGVTGWREREREREREGAEGSARQRRSSLALPTYHHHHHHYHHLHHFLQKIHKTNAYFWTFPPFYKPHLCLVQLLGM